MSSTHTTQPEKKQSIDLPAIFEIFCENKFANWERHHQDEEYQQIMTFLKPKYGNSVFYSIVNYVSENENITVIDLLREFGEFKNSYY